jgi:hypothetical protein
MITDYQARKIAREYGLRYKQKDLIDFANTTNIWTPRATSLVHWHILANLVHRIYFKNGKRPQMATKLLNYFLNQDEWKKFHIKQNPKIGIVKK